MSYRRSKIIFASFFVLGLAWPAHTQTFQPLFQHFTIEDGLPSSEVYYILQDQQDYLWFGTDEGVARFDGNTFEVFGPEQGLEHSVIFKIVEDADGVIWVSTYQGTVFFYQNGCFHHYIHNQVLEELKKSHHLVKLVNTTFPEGFQFEVRGSVMFYLDKQGQINWLTENDPSLIYLYHQPNQSELNPIKSVVRRFRSRKRKAAKFKKVLSYDHQQQDWTKLFEVDMEGEVETLIPEPKQNQQIVITDKQIWRSSNTSKIAPSSNSFEKQLGTNYAFKHQEHGYLLCRANGGGLDHWIYLEESSSLELSTTLLPGYSIAFGLYDRQGGLWLASSDSGVFYAPFPNTPVFVAEREIQSTQLRSIALVGDSSFYAGYSNGDIQYYNFVNGDQKVINVPTDYYSFKIFSLFYDEQRDLLYNNRFIYQTSYQGSDRSQSMLSLKMEDGRRTGALREIHQRNPQNLNQLLFTGSNRLGYINLENQLLYWTFSPKKGQKEEHWTFHCYYIDYQGRHWVGNLHGLLQFFPGQNRFVEQYFGHPALQSRVVKITQLPDRSFLFGTRGNGVVFHNQDTTYNINTKAGLISDNIREIKVSDQGVTWVTSKDGLSKLQFTDDGCIGELRNFGKSHGLPNEEILNIALQGEQVWVATSAGISSFIEPIVDTISKPPSLNLVTVNGKKLPLEQLKSLSAQQNSLDIQFHTIDYRLGDQINYRYRLAQNRPWQYTQQNEVEYPGLLPGHYQFEVQSQNRDGYWSKSTILPIYLATPWYNLLWVQLLAALFIVLSLVTFFYQRDQRRRKEQAYIQQIDRLERAALQAQMNPHFVFNSLNSIQHFILQNDVKQAAQYLAKFARLIRDTLRVSAHGQHSLSEEIRMLENYISLEKLRFKDGFSYQLTIDDQLIPDKILIPTLLIQPYVENAIKHGLKYRESNGRVEINFAGNPQELKVSITDNGTGFEPSAASKADSMGMNITRRRLELMSKTKRNCQMEVNFLKDDNRQIIGTEIIIFIQTAATPPQKLNHQL